jgi:hypothetical protein
MFGYVASSCLSIRPSVRLQQLGFQWTDFREILHLRIFRKSVKKLKVSLESSKILTGTFRKTYVHL